jgi:hypothetical protein
MSTGAKKMMQSTLDQWVALEKLTDTAKEVLPEEECKVIDKTVKNGATRTLHRLEERRKTPPPQGRRVNGTGETPEEQLPDEPTDLVELRQVLERQAE